MPETGVSELRVPRPGMAAFGISGLCVPGTRVSELRVPGPGMPAFSISGRRVPGTGVSELRVPRLGMPAFGISGRRVPGTGVSEVRVPRLGMAAFGISGLRVPMTRVPGNGMPGLPERHLPNIRRAGPTLPRPDRRVRGRRVTRVFAAGRRVPGRPAHRLPRAGGAAAEPVGARLVTDPRPVTRPAVPRMRPPVLLVRRPGAAHRSGSLPRVAWCARARGDYIMRQPRTPRHLVWRMRQLLPRQPAWPPRHQVGRRCRAGAISARSSRIARSRSSRTMAAHPRPSPWPPLRRHECRPSRVRSARRAAPAGRAESRAAGTRTAVCQQARCRNLCMWRAMNAE
jgi:hypothetical protein